MKKKFKSMTPQTLGRWLENICEAEWWIGDGVLYAVANVDHIEPGAYAALFAEGSGEDLLVTELTEYFFSPSEARIALQIPNADVCAPLPLLDWLSCQFLTDRSAEVRPINIK